MINADDNKSRNNNSNKIYDSGNNDNKNHINGIGNYSTKDNEHDNDKLILIRKIMMMTSKIIMKMKMCSLYLSISNLVSVYYFLYIVFILIFICFMNQKFADQEWLIYFHIADFRF